MLKDIYFDMDGTLCDLYGCQGWLADLEAERTAPYDNAKPLLNFQAFARKVNALQRKGYTINIISCTAKNGSQSYNGRVEQAKRKYLAKHLKSVKWDSISIIPYDRPKNKVGKGILFDDEERHRKVWNGKAYNEKEIMNVLKGL